jgi:hypothetical protein
MLNPEFDAFDAAARLPVTVPPDVGEKPTLKFTLWPALRVKGKLKPLVLKPDPVVPTAEIVTLPPPEFVMISARV